jgi:hypothetical protein
MPFARVIACKPVYVLEDRDDFSMLLTQYYSYIEIKSTIFANIDFLVQKVERSEPVIRHG